MRAPEQRRVRWRCFLEPALFVRAVIQSLLSNLERDCSSAPPSCAWLESERIRNSGVPISATVPASAGLCVCSAVCACGQRARELAVIVSGRQVFNWGRYQTRRPGLQSGALLFVSLSRKSGTEPSPSREWEEWDFPSSPCRRRPTTTPLSASFLYIRAQSGPEFLISLTKEAHFLPPSGHWAHVFSPFLLGKKFPGRE